MPKWSTTAIQTLGATAGLIALAVFVGGAMLWLRFDGLHLPADRAVALLPKELLLVVGAQALMLPLAIGAAALLWLTVLDPLDEDGEVERRFCLVFLPSVIVLIAVMFAFTADMDVTVIAIATVVGAVGVLLIARTADHTKAVRNIGWVVFAVFAVLGAVVNVLHMRFEPRMEPVAALLEQGKGKDPAARRGFAGFFVGETPERLWLVSLPSDGDPGDPLADAAVDRVVGIPRPQISRIAMREPAGVESDESGSDQAHSLFAELQLAARGPGGPTEPVTTSNPEAAFAPLVNLHSMEEWLPMSARGFLDQSVLYWSHGSRCKPEKVAVGARHVPTVPRYALDALLGVDRMRDERLGERAKVRRNGDRRTPQRDPGLALWNRVGDLQRPRAHAPVPARRGAAEGTAARPRLLPRPQRRRTRRARLHQ